MKTLFSITLCFVFLGCFGQAKDNRQRIFNVEMFGARGDANDVTDAVAVATHNTISSATANFTAQDVGKACLAYGTGTAGANQQGTITGFNSSTQVTVSFTTVGSVSSKEFFYGTEAQTGIQAAINACDAAKGGKVFLPNGVYFLGGALVTSANGINPNAQLYIPFHSFTGQFEYSIEIAGESAVNLASGYYGTANPIPTTGVVIRSTITGSGTNPSILAGGNSSNDVATSVWIKNLNIQAYTNQGASPPTMNCVLFTHMYKASGERICASLDVPNQNSTTPTGTQSTGIGISFRSNAGPNVWSECSSMGFKYGFIIGEHTELLNCYAFSCIYGFAFTKSDYTATGFILYHACINGLLFPNYSESGQLLDSGISKVMDLHVEAEIDTGAFAGGYWYNSFVSNISDIGNHGYGIIRTCSVIGGTGATSGITVLGGSHLTSLAYDAFPTGAATPLSTVLIAGNTSTAGQQLIMTGSSGTTSISITGSSTTQAQFINGGMAMQSYAQDNQFWGSNIIYNSGYKYITTNTGSVLNTGGGAYYFNGFASGSAGGTASPAYINVMAANGNVIFSANGVDNSTGRLQILTTTTQLALAYDATHKTQFLNTSAGDLQISNTNNSITLPYTVTVGHLYGSGSAPTSGTLGTNVTSATVTGTDNDFKVVVVTSGAASGTLFKITYNNTVAWSSAPRVIMSLQDATTAGACTAMWAGATSTTNVDVGGTISGAGTYTLNFHSMQ